MEFGVKIWAKFSIKLKSSAKSKKSKIKAKSSVVQNQTALKSKSNHGAIKLKSHALKA